MSDVSDLSTQDISKDSGIRVLYIAGAGRSGSTLLGNILGQVEGFFTAGELISIWERGLIQDRFCGCGVSFHDCEVWTGIFRELARSGVEIGAQEMSHFRRRFIRTRYAPLLLSVATKQLLMRRLEGYMSNLSHLYKAIHNHTNDTVIVDSSKSALYGYLLRSIEAVDMYVVHLVRDPRGVAYSWQRRKPRLDGQDTQYMRQHNSVTSALRWCARNSVVEVFFRRPRARYLILRYEDLIQRPKETLTEIMSLLHRRSSLPFLSEGTVDLKKTHTIAGNPSRFEGGTVKLRPDTAWMAEMQRADRHVVGALTWPWLLRYGYTFT
jgi:hypothetical protein